MKFCTNTNNNAAGVYKHFHGSFMYSELQMKTLKKLKEPFVKPQVLFFNMVEWGYR